MFINFLRTSTVAASILAVLRVYLGYKWLMSGWGKVSTGGFDASGFLQFAVQNATGEKPTVSGWWADFLTAFAIPNVELFNTLIPVGEIAVGLGLILGCLTPIAVFFGLVMNFSFMFSGVTGPNPLMVLLGTIILVSGYNAGRIGLDFFVYKYFKRKRRFQNDVQPEK